MPFKKGETYRGNEGRQKYWMEVPKEQWPEDYLNVSQVFMYKQGHLLVKRAVSTYYKGDWYIYDKDGETVINAKSVTWGKKVGPPFTWARKQIFIHEEISLRKKKHLLE